MESGQRGGRREGSVKRRHAHTWCMTTLPPLHAPACVTNAVIQTRTVLLVMPRLQHHIAHALVAALLAQRCEAGSRNEGSDAAAAHKGTAAASVASCRRQCCEANAALTP